MRRTCGTALTLLLAAASIALWFHYVDEVFSTPVEHPALGHRLRPGELPSSQFLQICSGLNNYTETNRLMARANCLGRVRGYADSHEQTIKMLQQTYAISQSSQLWCIPRDITDNELLTTIVNWADSNVSAFEVITDTYSGSAGAMGVLAAALKATYPCSPK